MQKIKPQYGSDSLFLGSGQNRRSLFNESASIDIELFAGAGGLTLGLIAAGLSPQLLFETDGYCCKTLLRNSPPRGCHIKGVLFPDDVGSVDWETTVTTPVRLLSGGPPCQPFSLAGKHLADQDERNEFPSMLRAIRVLRPEAIIIENVHGLARQSFRPYMDYIVRQIKFPEVFPAEEELWEDHDKRIRNHEISKGVEPEYQVCHGLVNAADHGVPQARSRLVILATRNGLAQPNLPPPSHSREALMRDQGLGVYWERHGRAKKENKTLFKSPPGCIPDPKLERKPWQTVRDVLATLPSLQSEDACNIGHQVIPGARLYRGHKGSDLDWVSKTIKAGVHGVAGGENVIILDDGSHRYFTLREMARLQGFPDGFVFEGPRSRIIAQVGNAVPCELARALGGSISRTLTLSVG